MVGSPGFLPPEILAPGWYDPMRGTSLRIGRIRGKKQSAGDIVEKAASA